jgi:lipoate-protein ligase A
LFVKDGIIKECQINGDFFFVGDINELQNIFIGCKYDKQELEKKLCSNDIVNSFHLITTSELAELFK